MGSKLKLYLLAGLLVGLAYVAYQPFPMLASILFTSGCDQAEFEARVKRNLAAGQAWAPGEMPTVDEERALIARLQKQAQQTGDYEPACRALTEWDDEHTERGSH